MTKLLLRVFEKLRPQFEEGGSLKPLKPVFEATENFFFAPEKRTETAPHLRDPLDVKRYMSMVIIALLPCVAASLYFFGLRVLAVIMVSYVVGGTVETLFAVIRKEEINEGFLVTGLIFPLVLPPGLPLWMVGVGVAFGVFVGKELFGGTGRNVFNPAIVGRCFLALAHPAAMAGTWITPGSGGMGRLMQYVEADAVSSPTPLVLAKQALEDQVAQPTALWDLFIGNVSGSIGETSALALIVGGVFLLLTRVSNWRTVVGVLGTFAILGGAFNILSGVFEEAQFFARFGPVGFHMLAGGLLLGAFFMATDPVTSPITNAGKWVYGGIIGLCTLLIRNLTGYVEGMMFAILLGNICAPMLDEIVFRVRVRRLKNER